MKMTKANMIKVLKAMADNNYAIYLKSKDDDEKMARDCFRSYMTLEQVTDMMTDTRYFEQIARIYFPEEE